MTKPARNLNALLDTLTVAARQQGLSDSAWARRAGLRKETLSRVRARGSCDYKSLEALALAVGTQVQVLQPESAPRTDDGHFPAKLGREGEAHLLELAAASSLDWQRWAGAGPAFFMSGLAVMLASVRVLDRPRLLALAERLHPGSSQPEVFKLWLASSPVRPSRFVPMLKERLQRAA